MTDHDELDAAASARLRAALDGLPAEIPPARDLWPAIRAALPPRAARPRWWMSAPRLAAAAVLLVAATAATTYWLTRPTPTAGDPQQAFAFVAPFERSAADLMGALDRRRGALDPATLAVLERSLRTIDGAIAEARAALVADPGNAAVQAFVASAYRQKLDFLRRANDVAVEQGP